MRYPEGGKDTRPGALKMRAVSGVTAVLRSTTARRVFGVGSAVLGLGAAVFTARHFASAGWPIHQANVWLVVVTGELFVIAYGLKAWGWRFLFAHGRRPRVLTLAAAGGAASV